MASFSQKKSSPDTFKKESAGDNYHLSDTVKIQNGKGEEIKVAFDASVPKNVWDDYVKKKGTTDKEYFSLLAGLLSINAQYQLKNELSFEPFQKQFFAWMNSKFQSSYKMMGRNGYGNLVETSVLAVYDPSESPTGIKSDSVKPKTVDIFKKN